MKKKKPGQARPSLNPYVMARNEKMKKRRIKGEETEEDPIVVVGDELKIDTVNHPVGLVLDKEDQEDTEK